MMLFCPRCGDYYADAALAFCLADGTPLVSVDLSSERASEGSRIIEQKEKALRKQKQRQQWWRVSSVMTMLIMTMVAYGVVAKRYVYLIPAPSPTPISSPSPSPTPTIVIKKTPTPTIVIRETPTPTIVIRETPTPTIVIKKTPTPTIVIRETPTPTPTRSPTPQVCSNADERREEQTIRSYFPTWRRNIEGERAKIITENVPDGAKNAEAILGEIEFQVAFVIPCKSAVITARYAWQVSYSQVPYFVNGTPSKTAPSKTKTVSRRRTIGCGKVFGMWVCR